MDVDQYLFLLNNLCAQMPSEVGIQPWLEQRLLAGDATALEALQCRQALLGSRDREHVAGLVEETGVFPEFNAEERAAALVLTFELEDLVGRVRLAQQCEVYSASQPLFSELPSLLTTARNRELIPVSQLDDIRSDGIVTVGRLFTRLSPFLPLTVVDYVRTEYPSVPLFVRLDPYFVSRVVPPTVLTEAVRIPPNPNWWRTLAIRVRDREGAVYELDGTEPLSGDFLGFWDYRVRGVRRLETSAVRRSSTFLTMMLEELQIGRADELIGRCVHLDSASVDGKTPSTALVSHLDLAINIYEGEDMRQREQQHLRSGKVQDATRRTHLLRTEGVRLQDMIPVCERFFRSVRLTREVVQSEFM